jgi:exopolyphosphatase/guanosine-5'-triphosphate,3'-diphosphate pyrophosphatase
MKPTRVAAIDVGSNAIRYVVAEVSAGVYQEIESERVAVRLGTDVFSRARTFREETMDTAVAVLFRIRRRLDDLGIDHYRAVATSAVREARNGGVLVERVRRESGIHLETISGSEEARLVWIAVTNEVDFGDHRWLMMDLGGGSVEISVADKDGILWSESHTLGSVRMLQTFQEEGEGPPSGAAYQELLERYTHVLKVPRAVGEFRPTGTIATGGNIDALADLAKAPRDERGVARLPFSDLHGLISKLGAMTAAQRTSQLGLREDRADVILPASVVYERVAQLAGAEEIVVPGVGVKEGLVLDLVDWIRRPAGRTAFPPAVRSARGSPRAGDTGAEPAHGGRTSARHRAVRVLSAPPQALHVPHRQLGTAGHVARRRPGRGRAGALSSPVRAEDEPPGV